VADVSLDWGREVCGDLSVAERREWLVANGLGGFACGTVAGTLTRRYHGLLVAALRPPLGRRLVVTKVEEDVDYGGRAYALSTNRWAGGSVAPEGYGPAGQASPGARDGRRRSCRWSRPPRRSRHAACRA
jgi:glycogen debranching enzyme